MSHRLLPQCVGRTPCPLRKRTDKALVVLKPNGLCDLFDRTLGAQQQVHGDVTAYRIFERLQRRPFFFELSVQGAGR